MRAAVHAPRDPSRVLERRHDLAEIVERGGRVLAEHTMTKSLAQALYQKGDAPRDDIIEAAEMLTEHSRRLRQVLGSAHPTTQRNEINLERIREHVARPE